MDDVTSTFFSPTGKSSSAALRASISRRKRSPAESSKRLDLNSYLMQKNQASTLVATTPTSSSRKRKRTPPSGIQALMPQLKFSNDNTITTTATDASNIITPTTRTTTQTRLPFQLMNDRPPNNTQEDDSIASYSENDDDSGDANNNGSESIGLCTTRNNSPQQHQSSWIYYDSNRRRAITNTSTTTASSETNHPQQYSASSPSSSDSGNSTESNISVIRTNEKERSFHSATTTTIGAETETHISKQSTGDLTTDTATSPTNAHHPDGGTFQQQQKTDAVLDHQTSSSAGSAVTRTLPPQTAEEEDAIIMQLNAKQAQALQAFKDKKNVFLTGPAGTGKSVVLRQVLQYCSSKYRSWEWVAVAPTGVTAIAIGGQTIHSFAGIGIPKEQGDFHRAWQNEKRGAWRELKIMVIEEVSMIAGEFLDRLDSVVRRIRGVDKPFGGIQLMICGDFLQLPPIVESLAKMREMRAQVKKGDPGKIHGNRGFAFQSYFWKEANLENIHLTEVFRQDNPQFVNVLSRIRRGIVDHEADTFLASCARPLTLPNKDIEPTRLYSKNVDVNQENLSKLARLDGDLHEYEAVDHVIVESSTDPRAEEKLWNSDFFRHTVAEDRLRLKVGAQVMLTKNGTRTLPGNRLVNGSRGVVVGFTTDKPEAPFHIPISVPKSNSHRPDKQDMHPIVKFQNGETIILGRAEFSSRIVGLGRCVRLAVPLKLAWAITVHKSQGMTLDYVKIDLRGVFCEAQAYVALSRAKDEKCLELRNFSRRIVKANARALAFYDRPNDDDEIPNWDHRAKWNRPKVKVESTQNEAIIKKERDNDGGWFKKSLV